MEAEGTKDRRKPSAATNSRTDGKALSEMLALNRTGENPPYGILGRAMETAASFEARSAPSLYPTTGKE